MPSCTGPWPKPATPRERAITRATCFTSLTPPRARSDPVLELMLGLPGHLHNQT